jgi:hypothetical protein
MHRPQLGLGLFAAAVIGVGWWCLAARLPNRPAAPQKLARNQTYTTGSLEVTPFGFAWSADRDHWLFEANVRNTIDQPADVTWSQITRLITRAGHEVPPATYQYQGAEAPAGKPQSVGAATPCHVGPHAHGVLYLDWPLDRNDAPERFVWNGNSMPFPEDL